jgi:RNA polymerase sigma factor (sigma-70 family)
VTYALHESAEQLLRDLAPQVLGGVARKCGDFADAEDAVQEALIAAAAQWPSAGIPTNPRGWLFSVAMRRLTDHMRSESARRRREDDAANEHAHDQPFVSPADAERGVMTDDTLVLLFMCCHSALSPSSAVALTLRAVGGLTTAEIASAFLVPEATMAQRISRAKQSIKSSGTAFRMPTDEERTARSNQALAHAALAHTEQRRSNGTAGAHASDRRTARRTNWSER